MSDGRSDLEIKTGDNQETLKTKSPRISEVRSAAVIEKPLIFEAEVIPYDRPEGADSPTLAFSGDNIHITFSIPKESFLRMATAAIGRLEVYDNESHSGLPASPDSARRNASHNFRDRNGNSGKISEKTKLDDVVYDLDADNTAEVIRAFKEDGHGSRANSGDPEERRETSTDARTLSFKSERPNYNMGRAQNKALEISNPVSGTRTTLVPTNPLVNGSQVDPATEIHEDVSVLLNSMVDEASTRDGKMTSECSAESTSSDNEIAKAVRSVAISKNVDRFSENRRSDCTMSEKISEAFAEGMSERSRHSCLKLSADVAEYIGGRKKCEVIGRVVDKKDLTPERTSNTADETEEFGCSACGIDVKKYKINIPKPNTFTTTEDKIKHKTVDRKQTFEDRTVEKNGNLSNGSNLTVHTLNISSGSCPELESAWPDIYPFAETEWVPITEIKSCESVGVLTKYLKLGLSNEFIVVQVSVSDSDVSLEVVKYKEINTHAFATERPKSNSTELNSFGNREVSEVERLPEDNSESEKAFYPRHLAKGLMPHLGGEMNINSALEKIVPETHAVNMSETNVKIGSFVSQPASTHEVSRSENVSAKQSLDQDRESSSKEVSESSKESIFKVDAIEISAEVGCSESSEINFEMDETSSDNTASTVEVDKLTDVEISNLGETVQDAENKESTAVFALDIELSSDEVNIVNVSGNKSPSERNNFILEDSFKGSDNETAEVNPTEKPDSDASERQLHDQREAKVSSSDVTKTRIVAPSSVEPSVETMNNEFPSRHISTSSPKCNSPDEVISKSPEGESSDAENESPDVCLSTESSNLEDLLNHTRRFLENELSKLMADDQNMLIANSVSESKSSQDLVPNEENGIPEETDKEDSKIKPVVKSNPVDSDTVQHKEAGFGDDGIDSLQKIEDTGDAQTDNLVIENAESDTIKKPLSGESDCCTSENVAVKNDGSQSRGKDLSGNQESGSSEKISAEDVSGFLENTASEDAKKVSPEKNPVENTKSDASEETVIDGAERDSSVNIEESRLVEYISNKDAESSSSKKVESKTPKDEESSSTETTLVEDTKNESFKNICTKEAGKNIEETENKSSKNISAEGTESSSWKEQTVPVKEESESPQNTSSECSSEEKTLVEEKSESPKNISDENSDCSSEEKTPVEESESPKNISAEHSKKNAVEEIENKSFKKEDDDSKIGSAEETMVETVNEPEEIFTAVDGRYPQGQTTKKSPVCDLKKTVTEITTAHSSEDHPTKSTVNDSLGEALAEVKIGSPEKTVVEDTESRSSVKQVTNSAEKASSVNTAVEDAEDKKFLAENVESAQKMAVEHMNGAASRETPSEDADDERPEKTIAAKENGLPETKLPAVRELKDQTQFDGSVPESTDGKVTSETNTEVTSESDALESDEGKSMASESDDGRDCEGENSKSGERLKKDSKFESDETDCAPTRVRTRKALSHLSEDAIPEHTVTKSTKSTRVHNFLARNTSKSSGKISPAGRSLRSKSLDPSPQKSKMPSHDRKSGDAVTEFAEGTRKKRAATPEVISKKDIKTAVRSSPRKVTRAATVNPDSNETPKVPNTRSSTADNQAKSSRSYLNSSATSLTTRRTKKGC